LARSTAELILGVDAGATKTHALACDRRGHVLGFGTAGPGNWESVGADGSRRALARAISGALEAAGAEPGAVGAAGFGLAGLDWPSDRPILEEVVGELGIGGRHAIVNDAFIALRAGCRAPFGVVSVAGTGVVTAGRNRAGEAFRTMAIGYGERGGGGELTTAALHAIALEYHGSGPATELTARILERAGADSVPTLFEGISRGSRSLPSGLPRLVLEIADEGDPTAAAIAAGFGAEMARAAKGVADRLGMAGDAFELVRSGSVHLSGSRTLDSSFAEAVAAALPRAAVVPLKAPPAIGAALIAMELGGPVSAKVHDRLAAEATRARAAAAAAS
jgi:N-acetylglucosamine kinase-like BadF-type ATPase